jgi:hypothetical protein
MSQSNLNDKTTLTGKRKLEDMSENSSSDEDEECLFLQQGLVMLLYHKFYCSNY